MPVRDYKSQLEFGERIANARADKDLAWVEDLVERFRIDFPTGEERGWVTVCLAAAYYHAQQFARSEMWALRAMQLIPRRDAAALLGEIAWLRDDVEGALSWYKAATAMLPIVNTPELSLVEDASRRYQEMQVSIRLWPLRGTVRAPHPVIVLTVPGRETFSTTMESLRNARAPEPVVMADTDRKGQAFNFFRALDWIVEKQAPAATIVEDDTLFARNAFEYIFRVKNDLMLLSWYSSGPFPFRSEKEPAIVGYSAMTWAGAPAITVPYDTALVITSSRVRRLWDTPHQADTVFRKVSPDRLCGVHFPNLVQHRGAESLTGNSGLRESPSFVGEDFDANELLQQFS